MTMYNPAHPGALIRETIETLREETGNSLTIEEVATRLGTTRKNYVRMPKSGKLLRCYRLSPFVMYFSTLQTSQSQRLAFYPFLNILL